MAYPESYRSKIVKPPKGKLPGSERGSITSRLNRPPVPKGWQPTRPNSFDDLDLRDEALTRIVHAQGVLRLIDQVFDVCRNKDWSKVDVSVREYAIFEPAIYSQNHRKRTEAIARRAEILNRMTEFYRSIPRDWIESLLDLATSEYRDQQRGRFSRLFQALSGDDVRNSLNRQERLSELRSYVASMTSKTPPSRPPSRTTTPPSRRW